MRKALTALFATPLLLAALVLPATSSGATPPPSFAAVYAQWANGPDPSGAATYFPIGVFYQGFDNPAPAFGNEDSALAYEAAGINLQVAGYDCSNGGCPGGVRDPMVVAAVRDNAKCACDVQGAGAYGQNSPFTEIGDEQAYPSTVGAAIQANMNISYDEADMNEPNGPVDGPLSAQGVSASYQAVKQADPTRPLAAGYGKCFSIPDWNGCQAGVDGPGGYSAPLTQAQAKALYCQYVDIVSSDYYADDPGGGDGPGHNYEFGVTVDNERQICGPSKIAGFDVQTGNLGSGTISVADIRDSTWDGIMHGANFVNYFVDDFNSAGSEVAENGLLDTIHANAYTQVKAQDKVIAALAGWLNAPDDAGLTVASTNGIPVTTMLKTYNGHQYLFAMADGNTARPLSGATTATFTVGSGSGTVKVYGGGTVTETNGVIVDPLTAYEHRVYELS